MRITMYPPPPMLPASGIHDGEREPHRDRRVDGVAAALENLDARLARQRPVARHHRVRAEHRGPAGLVRPRVGEGGRSPITRVRRDARCARRRKADVGGAGSQAGLTTARDDRNDGDDRYESAHSTTLRSQSETPPRKINSRGTSWFVTDALCL